MSGHDTIPPERAWFTWSARPAELVNLPLGLRLTPVLYSTRARATGLIEPRADSVRFGPHTVDASHMALETTYHGTTIAFTAGADGPFAVRAAWQAQALGEWGARFWISLAVSADDGSTLHWDAAEGALIAKVGARYAAVVTRDAPLLVTGHETLAALRTELEANGYFHTGARAESGAVMGLRFNLDMMREGGFAAGIADRADLAVERARAALGRPLPAPPVGQTGAGAGALDAVRDIVGWNTVWDATNHRPYTAVTRIWNLGEFAVWYNDQCYAALLAGLFDTDLARRNLEAAHAGATPQGNIACLVTSHGVWADRSQPPLGSLIAWMLYLRSGERSILEAHFDTLARNQRWWRTHRDPDGSGLISCGTSEVGEALYRGTHFGARNETGMDNSATHDEAVLDPATGHLSTWDLGLNCAVALDAEMLARIAGALGRAAEAAEFAALAEAHRDRIRTGLWDESRAIFANRQRGGGFVRALSPTSFYPLLCGAADAAQTEALLGHLDNPATFAGAFPLPNATRDDPAFADNVYWRGRIWPNVNYLVWLGLRRAGHHERAARLAAESHAMFEGPWRRDRIAGENYNADTGEVLDQGDTDGFYIWAGLLPLMAVEEICAISPWEGWCLTNGPDAELGPVATPIGPARVTRRDGTLRLTGPGGDVLETDFPGRISELRIGEGAILCQIGAADKAATITFPGIPAGRVIAAEIDGAAVALETGGAASLRLPAADHPRSLSLWLRGAVI